MGMEEALDFWISQLKITGREFHPEVVKAAQAVLPRVLAYGQQDPTAAVELFGESLLAGVHIRLSARADPARQEW